MRWLINRYKEWFREYTKYIMDDSVSGETKFELVISLPIGDEMDKNKIFK